MTGSTLRVETANSTYEIEHAEGGIRVRRLTGINAPTPNIGQDGQWRDASTYDVLADGLIFYWLEPRGKATLTSPVRSIEVTA